MVGSFFLTGLTAMLVEAVGEVEGPNRLRLQLKVKVLWVEVMNPYVSVLSSAAVTVGTQDMSKRNVSGDKRHFEQSTPQFKSFKQPHLLPSGWNATQLMGPK